MTIEMTGQGSQTFDDGSELYARVTLARVEVSDCVITKRERAGVRAISIEIRCSEEPNYFQDLPLNLKFSFLISQFGTIENNLWRRFRLPLPSPRPSPARLHVTTIIRAGEGDARRRGSPSARVTAP